MRIRKHQSGTSINVAKRRPNSIRSERPKRPKRPKAPSPVDVLFGFLGKMLEGFAAPPVQYFRCVQCGCVVGLSMARVPKETRMFCPAGHGPVMEPFDPRHARPLPNRARVSKMSREDAAAFLSKHSEFTVAGLLNNTNTCLRPAYLQALKRLHPDKATGNHELFVKLQEAMEVLEG